MSRVFNGRLFVIVLLACLAAACDDDVTTNTPIAPTLPKTETFTGVVTQNGAATHNFDVGGGGAVTALLKSVGSDNTLVVSFALGTWTGSACSVVLANDAATSGAVLNGTMTGIGTLCARVSDVGNIGSGPGVPYTIEVLHP
jgi:hypothetical protein